MSEDDCKLLRQVSGYFGSDGNRAFKLLQSHYRAPRIENGESKPAVIVIEDGTEIPLEDFCHRHELAYQRRLRSRSPDEVRLLEMELSGRSGAAAIGGGTPEIGPSLDYYDTRIDRKGQYQSRYGRYPRRS